MFALLWTFGNLVGLLNFAHEIAMIMLLLMRFCFFFAACFYFSVLDFRFFFCFFLLIFLMKKMSRDDEMVLQRARGGTSFYKQQSYFCDCDSKQSQRLGVYMRMMDTNFTLYLRWAISWAAWTMWLEFLLHDLCSLHLGCAKMTFGWFRFGLWFLD